MLASAAGAPRLRGTPPARSGRLEQLHHLDEVTLTVGDEAASHPVLRQLVERLDDGAAGGDGPGEEALDLVGDEAEDHLVARRRLRVGEPQQDERAATGRGRLEEDLVDDAARDLAVHAVLLL